MEQSFQYKWEESDRITPSAVHLEKNSTLVMWAFFLLLFLCGLFFIGYKKHFKSANNRLTASQIQSLHSFGMEPFLVRISSSETGTALVRVKMQFFVNDIRVQNELIENKNQYKEHFIFFLSKTQMNDFFDDKQKQELEKRIKNHINAFLSNGQIQQISIKEQFI